jgi:RimJ/RimL family protein N-acetyltransferase
MGLAGLKIVSGGQTGVDRAALDWALANGIEHNGWCPHGRKAEDGAIPVRYQLKETPSANYVQRTEWNVRDSDATVIISLKPVLASGSQKTLDFARKQRKPCLVLSRSALRQNAGSVLQRFVQDHKIKILNIAGPRESEESGVGAFAAEVLNAWYRLALESHPPELALTTARLVLRPFAPADAHALAQLAGRKEIADTTVSIPHPYSPEQAGEWISRLVDLTRAGKEIAAAITLNGSLVGVVGLRDIDTENSQAELGYWISVEHWGNGYATEAAEAALRFGFEELGLNRICAHYMVRNPASGRVLAKIGMKEEGVLRQRVKKWAVFEDVLVWAVLRRDWLKRAV